MDEFQVGYLYSYDSIGVALCVEVDKFRARFVWLELSFVDVIHEQARYAIRKSQNSYKPGWGRDYIFNAPTVWIAKSEAKKMLWPVGIVFKNDAKVVLHYLRKLKT